MSDFRKALLWTAVPIVSLSLVRMVGGVITAAAGTAITGPWLGLMIAFGITQTVAAVCILAAIIVAIIFAISGKRQLMSGTLTGAAIGIVALGASCFAGAFTGGF